MTPEFALFSSTEVSLFDVDLPFLKIRAHHPLVDTAQELVVVLGEHRYRFNAVPVRRAEDGDIWVRLLDAGLSGEVLEHRFLSQKVEDAQSERRNSGRVKTILSVRSPDLPNSRGTTHDISQSGLRLVTEHPVEAGTELRLVIQGSTDTDDFHPVFVNGEAVWSAPRVNSLHHVGVRLNLQ